MRTSSDTCQVIRPVETVEGKTAKEAPATHGSLLHAGDHVLLLRSADGQTYYVVERMVKVSDEPVPND